MKYKFKTKPFAHQMECLTQCWNKENFALLMEMGTGKSKVLIDNIGVLYNQGKINGALIIAPKGVYKTWERQELPLHLPDYIMEHTNIVAWQSNLTLKQKLKLEHICTCKEELSICIMNVEAFSTNKGYEFARTYAVCRKLLIVVDESTTIKNISAIRSKQIIKLRDYAKYRRILTGQPVTKSPIDLYSQFYFLDPDILNFSSFYTFKSRYAKMIRRSTSTHDFNMIVGYRNLDELSEKMKDYSYRVLKENCLDLPDKVYMKRSIELTKEQLKAYKEIQHSALTELANNKIVSVTNVLSAITKLQQVVCGHIITDNGDIADLQNNRIKELLNILDECSGKVIIWANFRHSIKRIQEAIAKKYGEESCATYFGDTKADERQDIIEKFQDNDSNLRFFIGNQATGGFGVTLTKATQVIYYSNSYDLEKRTQSEDRCHRIGQTKKVTYTDLIAEKTIDEKIIKALKNKIQIANEVMGEKAREWLI
jgi:SNF2 family DNA or RNA helicase